MARTLNDRRVSNPTSTGGAGTFFEQHVGAYWLAELLVGGIPPILIDTLVTEVHSQTERLGWHTDDFLIVCEGTTASRKLARQVKRPGVAGPVGLLAVALGSAGSASLARDSRRVFSFCLGYVRENPPRSVKSWPPDIQSPNAAGALGGC
jgi:hypothetical protein